MGLPAIVSADQSIPGECGAAEQRAIINVSELAKQRQVAPATPTSQPRTAHPALRPAGKLKLPGHARTATATDVAAAGSMQFSPPPTVNFLAILDNNTSIPPDTMGAVGPNNVMTTLNSEVRIQNRSGARLSTVDMNSFWASLGNPDVFDPRLAYDEFNDRWIFSAVANSDLASAAVLVGVSATSDPTGNWFLFKADVDAANQNWADFDALGFNKDWIVVTANIFRNNNGPFEGVWVWAFNKADLYANGSGLFTLLKFVDNDPDFFTFAVAPAQTHDNSLATQYLVEDWNGSAGQLRVSTITGAVGSETLNIATSFPASTNLWNFFGGDDFAPQLGSTHGIDAGDSRILSCSYRNGSLWASHTTFVPAAPTHSVAQWWQFLPGGTVQQFGRVEDPTGSQFFAYPSITANASNDVLIGYSRFSASQYASANYSFRFATDPPNTLRADTVLKAGEASYFASDGSLNRWGDFSATCVDPLNDLTMWTIQEYAASPANTWGTWWGRIDPDLSALKLVLTRPADGISYPSNPTVTLTATGFDSNTTFTLIEFFADGTKIGEDGTEPYTITWTGVSNGAHSLTAIGTETGGGMTTSQVVIITVGDPASPIGVWDTKLSGTGKGNAVLLFNDDFTVSGHGMTLGTFGLFDITGTWNFDSKHLIAATYIETLASNSVYSGNFVAKVTAGKKFTATVTPGAPLAPALKLKGVPRLPVPDLSGTWSATVKVGTPTTMETYQFTASPTLLNVFDITGSVTGAVLETAKGRLNFTTEDFPKRSLAGKAKTTSFTAKGTDERNIPVNVKAVKQ